MTNLNSAACWLARADRVSIAILSGLWWAMLAGFAAYGYALCGLPIPEEVLTRRCETSRTEDKG